MQASSPLPSRSRNGGAASGGIKGRTVAVLCKAIHLHSDAATVAAQRFVGSLRRHVARKRSMGHICLHRDTNGVMCLCLNAGARCRGCSINVCLHLCVHADLIAPKWLCQQSRMVPAMETRSHPTADDGIERRHEEMRRGRNDVRRRHFHQRLRHRRQTTREASAQRPPAGHFEVDGGFFRLCRRALPKRRQASSEVPTHSPPASQLDVHRKDFRLV
mmetsp:Transcript_45082/g.124953  ORF Transcript_45082/g.124953 Transcript_45082/m.124953 type:complete len:217 (-) Transcript_45082:863-1513(-)